MAVLLNIFNRRIFLSSTKSVEQLSSEDDDDSDKDVEIHDNDSDIDDDASNIDENITKKQVPHSAFEEQELEELENSEEREPDKKKIRQ